jgi:hypothetical protein
MIKMQTFLCDGDQYVGGYGNPDLRLDGVLAGAKEHESGANRGLETLKPPSAQLVDRQSHIHR